jgi:hypothetical protein
MEIEVKKSAYKHGCTYDDIINCYRFPIVTKKSNNWNFRI